jgi:DNA-binding NtrC family response regulator
MSGFSNNECSECADLWRRYSETAQQHLGIHYELQMAGLQHDHAPLKCLLRLVQAAVQQQDEIRSQIENHEWVAHSEDDAAMDCAAPECARGVNPAVEPGSVDISDLPKRHEGTSDLTLEAIVRVHIERVFREADRNVSKAARILNIDRSTLYNKLRRYGLK